ncbi:hypothetical protein TrVE_jg4298 [Triparma verrucosa]|uniref:Uncharacterized protein n=1 Tax=Triparma verrucosa TaxID=1606542 RepID=A0A9W7C1U7_9STRA|nr:hypothetical protein TrVE_jg4298 [Triparma verrucosa]
MSSLKNVVEIPDSSDDEAVPAVTPKRYRGSGKADAPLEIESDSDGEPPAKRSLTAPAAPVPAQDPIKAARPRSLDTDAPAVDDLAEAEGGLWHVGMRQGGGADKTGARSLSEDDYKGILRRFGFEIAFDMRRGTLRSKTAGSRRSTCKYETRGDPKNGNLGGSEVSAYPGRGWPFLKNSGEIRWAMLDPRNTGGRPCHDAKKKTVTVHFDPDAYATLKSIADLSKTKRVVLLCVEDNLYDCHIKDLIAIMLEHNLIDSATAVEPTSMQPGAGWTNCTCASHLDWKGDLERVKAERYATKK